MAKIVLSLYGVAAALSIALLVLDLNAEAPTPAPSGTIVCNIPPEPVVRSGAHWVAKEVTGTVTIKVAGKTYTGTLTFPDTNVFRTGVGTMQVDACTARGDVK